MNSRAAILALLSTCILLQPLALPILSALRRKGPATALLWFLLALLPAFALSAVVTGFIVGGEDLFRPGAVTPPGEFAFFGTAQEEFPGVAPILAACILPSLMFVLAAIRDRRSRPIDIDHRIGVQA